MIFTHTTPPSSQYTLSIFIPYPCHIHDVQLNPTFRSSKFYSYLTITSPQTSPKSFQNSNNVDNTPANQLTFVLRSLILDQSPG